MEQTLCHYLERRLFRNYGSREIFGISRYFEDECRKRKLPTDVNLLSCLKMAWVDEWIDRLIEGEPIQYISGSAPFHEFDLIIRPGVLIPRPETEELAYRVQSEMRACRSLHVIDVGTGSGCIGIYLKSRNPSWKLTCIDISENAISCARENACKFGLDIDFRCIDFNHFLPEPSEKWDVLVSNPPYIGKSEASAMDSSVLNYEPHQALFAPDADALHFYRLIAEFGRKHLRADGEIFVEINPAYLEQTRNVFKDAGYDSSVCFNDLQGRPRILWISC
ncbi:MAG: peptide chain release factor N(5)-glutamine methyltransferase [Saprospiraceae bacterium]|nr:peptide chain release factor N(5)-glutamine methyltransferase [Saprospiraceae bacterium]